MNKEIKLRVFEWLGVGTAIVYSLLVAANIGAEFIGFTLLLASSAFIGIWAYLGKHRGILFLQFFLCNCRNYRNDSLVLANKVELIFILKGSNWTGESSGDSGNSLNLGKNSAP